MDWSKRGEGFRCGSTVEASATVSVRNEHMEQSLSHIRNKGNEGDFGISEEGDGEGDWMEEHKLTANTLSAYRNWCNDKGEASPDT